MSAERAQREACDTSCCFCRFACSGALVRLLLAVVSAGSTACSETHVAYFLAAYSPFLTSTSEYEWPVFVRQPGKDEEVNLSTLVSLTFML